ncbi:26518_t:CDS:1, partial [Gigaspora margarita]
EFEVMTGRISCISSTIFVVDVLNGLTNDFDASSGLKGLSFAILDQIR